jgi:hypothetical protein
MHFDVDFGHQRFDGGRGLRRTRPLRAALAVRSLSLALPTIPATPPIPSPASAFAFAVVRGDGLALRDRRDGRICAAGFLRGSWLARFLRGSRLARFLGRSLLAFLRSALLALRPLALLLAAFASVTIASRLLLLGALRLPRRLLLRLALFAALPVLASVPPFTTAAFAPIAAVVTLTT